MRILCITSANSGVGYHRIMMPIVNMQKDYALITDVLNDELLEQGWDILLMNRMLNEISAAHMATWLICIIGAINDVLAFEICVWRSTCRKSFTHNPSY